MVWFVVSACSVAADVRQFTVARAILCSLTPCMRDRTSLPYVCLGAVRTGEAVDYTRSLFGVYGVQHTYQDLVLC